MIKAYVRHPELAEGKANRDFLLKEVCEAIETINMIVQGNEVNSSPVPHYIQGTQGKLSSAIDMLDVSYFFHTYTLLRWVSYFFIQSVSY